MPSPPSSPKGGRTAPRVVRRLLKDGSTRVHTYPPWQAPAVERHGPDTVSALIRAYQRSPEWLRLAPATRSVYTIYLADVERLGRIKAAGVKRREILEIRDAIATTRGNGAATGFMRAASALFVWAVDREWIEHTPTARVRKLPGGTLPAWGLHHYRLACAALPEPLRRAAVLAFWTGQRRGDLCAMRWSDYDGKVLRFRQGKTGAEMVIPVAPALKAELAAWKEDRDTLTILSNHGAPWLPLRLSGALAYHLAKIEGLPAGLNIHGVRKLAAAQVADGGGTTHEIAALTGHRTLSMVAHYTRSADQEKLAGGAVQRIRDNALQRGNARSKPLKTR